MKDDGPILIQVLRKKIQRLEDLQQKVILTTATAEKQPSNR
ncbi:hypothetical protein [Bacillus sp. Marseille-Q3570]|nr:hypothetical protein [Bacillus sp. Marseille-Q3570]